MDVVWQSLPSMFVAGTLLFGAGSLFVLVLIVLLMSFDAVAQLTAVRTQHLPGSLVRLYDERVSPLVHMPRRRQALRSTLVVLLVFAPALPRLEINGWAPEARGVLWNVLRIVTSVGDGPGSAGEHEEGRLIGLGHAT